MKETLSYLVEVLDGRNEVESVTAEGIAVPFDPPESRFIFSPFTPQVRWNDVACGVI